MKKYFLLYLIPALFLLGACHQKDRDKETDHLYQYREYISSHTHNIRSVTTPIIIELAKPPDQFSEQEEIPAKYLSITPKTPGKLYVRDNHTLYFEPENHLKPDTEYRVEVRLEHFFRNIESDLRTYTFSFKTLAPDFKIDIADLQSYDQNRQFLRGSLETADYTDTAVLPEIIRVTQEGKELPIRWENGNTTSNIHPFIIDSIERRKEDSEILIRWNGKSIGADRSGEETFSIPGTDNFKIVKVETRYEPRVRLSLNFSNPLDAHQDFRGLVEIEGTEHLQFEPDGNILYIYPDEKVTGEHLVTVFPGIRDTEGRKMKEEFSEHLTFMERLPKVELISKGVILPGASSTPLYFRTAHLSAVDVRVIKIYKDNIMEFLQMGNLGASDDYYIRRVGRRVAKKTLPLDISQGEEGLWKAHAVKLSDLFEADPGALYRVEISFKKSYRTYPCPESDPEETEEDLAGFTGMNEGEDSEEIREQQYWDNEIYSWRRVVYDWENRDNPCHEAYYTEDRFAATNLLGSDLGLTVKQGSNNSFHIAATNLLTADPETGVNVSLYDYQKQLIKSVKTGADGMVSFHADRKPAFVIARKNNDYAYSKLEAGNALSVSKFDVAGQTIQGGLKGFIFTERGVHRPGDTIHLTFVLNDATQQLPEDIPVKLEVENALGKLVQRTVSHNGENSESARGAGNFYYFPVPTGATDVSGNWYARIIVGGVEFGKTLRVATVKPNRLKVDLEFDEEVPDLSRPITGELSSTWLHGAPARNFKAEVEATLRATDEPFDGYPQYIFTDPVRQFEETEFDFIKTRLSSEGKYRFSEEISVDKKAPGMLKATFLSKVFEGGGDFSFDVFSKNIAPYQSFVGLASPEEDRYGSYETDKNNRFDLITLDAQGKVSPSRKLRVQIFELSWQWWWNRDEDQLSQYENAEVHTPYQDFEITSDDRGRAFFDVNIPDEDGGRYLLRIIDEESGHATGRIAYFYKDWFENNRSKNAENATMLVFNADKEKYQVGETARITFPSGSQGHALISIENGTEVLSADWTATNKGETKVEIPITPEMAPNVYVNISLIQPHDQTKNDLPVRLYGIILIQVEDPATLLEPRIEMPEELKPNEAFTVRVSEKDSREMTYTIAMVDEGLLGLTRFRTPDIHGHFFSKEALGVKTFDIYDYVIGAFAGTVNNIYEIGGDDAAAKGEEHKANRFKPVVRYLGPFHLKAGEKRAHQITMPNYIGSVRVMVIAGNAQKGAFGNAEKTVPVKKPLMVLASLPRKLSPGETATMPVTVFAMDSKIKNATVRVEATEAFEALDGNTQTVRFDRPDEKVINFQYKIKPTEAVQKVRVEVTGGGEKASYDFEIDVVNPNPYTHEAETYQIDRNETRELTYAPYGVPGTNTVKLELSTLPPMDYTKRIQYLIHYPHGCVEQTTSAAFPQLFMDELFDLPYERRQETDHNIKAAIRLLGDAQLINGALPFWPGQNNPDAWATTYAGHFMLEAKSKGYALPISFTDNWIRYQSEEARRWRIHDYGYNTSLLQAYRLYTLALAGQPELAAMNRLREADYLTDEARWRLAGAYALAGKKDVALQIVRNVSPDFKPRNDDYRLYGSVFRNQAMALEVMVLLEDSRQRDLAVSLAGKLSSPDWLSTQETSFGLLAMSKMIQKNGGKALNLTLTQDGKETRIETANSLSEIDLPADSREHTIKLVNHEENVVFATLYREGKQALGEERVQSNNLTVTTRFPDGEGGETDVTRLHQGTEINAEIEVKNTSADFINNLTLTQIFPSGWEVVNTSFTELGGGAGGEANFIDIRDDRVYFHFDLNGGESKKFTVKLNASYLGKYYMPGTWTEAMYNNNYYASRQGKWVEIIP